jgi:hypothetical protein
MDAMRGPGTGLINPLNIVRLNCTLTDGETCVTPVVEFRWKWRRRIVKVAVWEVR